MSKDSPIDRYRKPVRKQGRPMFSNVYSGKCDVRLDKQELEMLDHLSGLNGVTKHRMLCEELYGIIIDSTLIKVRINYERSKD